MYYRMFLSAALVFACTVAAIARPPKLYYHDESLSDFGFMMEEAPGPQPPLATGPQMLPAEVACQPLVIHAFVMAWKSTLNGTRNHGLGESGFAIQSYMSSLSIQGWSEEPGNHLFIPAGQDTVAIAHVHGRGADEHPAGTDVRSRVPNFVISQDALYVTVPGTEHFIRLRGGVNDADGWNKPCSAKRSI
jgi:hypothetical protein